MRDPDRIAEVLTELQRVWLAWDQQRLCQLIVNVANTREPFFMDDDELLRRLKEFPV